MISSASKPNSGRVTFNELLESVRPQCRQRLAAKARLANQIAKIAPDRFGRAVAYAIKTAALGQGLRIGFRLRGDELGRPGLALVHTGSHGRLHVRVDALARDLLDRPDIRLRVHGSAA